MDKATLSDLKPADLQEWRALPVSVLLLEHLQRERADALEVIAKKVQEGERQEAVLAAGWLACLDAVWSTLHPPEPAPPEPEESWEDPGTIKEPA